MAVNRSDYKKGIQKQTKKSYDTKDDSGKFKSIFLEGIRPIKLGNAEHFLNVIPFKAGAQNPNASPGESVYVLDIWVHRGIGIQENSYICLSRTYQKPCPVCEYQNELRKLKDSDDYDEELIKQLNPSRRAVYNVEILDNDAERAKGVQIMEVSHVKFEGPFAALAKLPRGGGFIYFSDPDDGKILSFNLTGAGTMGIKFESLRFIDRDEIVSDDLLAKARVLDELIHIPTYDEVHAAFFASGEASADAPDERPEEGAEVETVAVPAPAARTEGDVPQHVEGPKYKCPAGGAIGEDFGSIEGCDTCKPKVKAACEAMADGAAAVTETAAPPAKPVAAPAPAPAARPSLKKDPAPTPAPAAAPPAGRPAFRKRA